MARNAVKPGFRFASPELRTKRLARSLSGRQLAVLAETPVPTLSRIEAGKLRASPERQTALARQLGTTVDEIFVAEEERPLGRRDQEIAGAWAAGTSMSELKRRYSLSRSRIGRILDSQGIKRTRGLDVATVDALVERYNAQATGSAIAMEFGVPTSTVYYHLERRGVARRPSNLPRKHPPAETRLCAGCGEPFMADGYRQTKGHAVYCSRACARSSRPARKVHSRAAQARVEKAAEEVARVAEERGLLTVKQAAKELGIAENNVTGRYIKIGVLPAQRVNLEGVTYFLIDPAHVKDVRRYWARNGNPHLDPSFAERWARGRGHLSRTADRTTLTEEQAAVLVRDQADRRRKSTAKYRAGRKPAPGPAPHHLEWFAAFERVRDEQLIAFESGRDLSILAPGDREPSLLDAAAAVAESDIANHPERWGQEYKVPGDEPGSYALDPKLEKDAARRVWKAVKALQNPVTEITAA